MILNIDTAVQSASICLSEKDKALDLMLNPSQKDQAAWIQPAIKEMMKRRGIELKDLDAVAVSSGPGSYTGLRVGLATAKGLCYALNLPLITVNTLAMMAEAVENVDTDLLCPMIDARRMEVFTAMYDREKNQEMAPVNLILDETSFKEQLEAKTVSFFGNGSNKFQSLIHHPNALFKEVEASAQHMIVLTYRKFTNHEFANLAYAEPFYGKEFYSPAQ